MTTHPEGHQRFVPQWTFADRLRKIRRSLNLTQDDMATTLGRGKKAYAAWEVGYHEPRDVVAVAQRIEMAYDVPAAWTLGVDENPTPPSPDGTRMRPHAAGNGAISKPCGSVSHLANARSSIRRAAA